MMIQFKQLSCSLTLGIIEKDDTSHTLDIDFFSPEKHINLYILHAYRRQRSTVLTTLTWAPACGYI